ncbi:LysR substrate-binding domain-containing protein [Azospirillum endophyticum]
MDLRQLRYFIAIVDEGSFTAAAQKLNVAQPALSHNMRNLEADLGVKLLTRGVHGVKPTSAGTKLYEHAEVILRHVAQATEQIRNYSGAPSGAVTIGLTSSVALVAAVPLVQAVRIELPQVSLRVVEAFSGTILEWLNDDRLDFGCLYDVTRSRSFLAEPLVREELYLICPPGEGGDDITFEELAGKDLILPSRPHNLRDRVERGARETCTVINVAVEINGLPQIKALVAKGVGYSVLPISAVMEEWRAGLVSARLIVTPYLHRSVHLCSPRGTPATEAASAVRAIFVRVVHDLVSSGVWPSVLLLDNEEPS